MNRTITVSLLMAGAIAGAVAWNAARDKPVPVTMATVERGAIKATVSNTRAGTVNTCNRARMSPILGGQIASLSVKPGEKVKAGDVLLELWNSDVRAQLQLTKQERLTTEARAQEACAVASVASREAERTKMLLAEKMISEERADIIVGEAKARAAACRATLNMVKVSAAQIALAEARIEQTILRAPFDGTVAEINGEVGEIVTPSPVGVATLPAVDLIDDSCTYVSAPIDEVDAPFIKAGMHAVISLDAFGDQTFAGTVRRVAPYVLDHEKQARTVEIEVEFNETSTDLLPGYSADVEVTIETRSGTLVVPTQAVNGNNQVLQISAEGLLQKQTITTGIKNWQVTEVSSGLREGDSIVLSVDREGVIAGAAAIVDDAQSGN